MHCNLLTLFFFIPDYHGNGMEGLEVSGRTLAGTFSKYFFLGSEEDSTLFCQPCDRDGPRVPAFGFCKDCTEHLCETCYKIHRKPTPCRKHVLLDKTTMPQTPLKKQPLLENGKIPQSPTEPSALHELTEPCQVHKGKFIEYFCCDHKVLGCSPCITVSHRNCKIDYIPKVSKNFKSNPEYIYLKHSFNILKECCKKILEFAKINKIKMQKNQTDVQKGVQNFRKEINAMLDKWETEINQQSYSIFAEESAKIDSIVTASGKLFTDISKLQDNFKTLEKENKNNSLLIQIKKKGRLVKQYKAIVHQMQEKNTINNYTFEPNLAIEKMLKLVTKLGYINVQTKGGKAQLPSPTQKEYLSKFRHRLSRNKWKKLQTIAEEEIHEKVIDEDPEETDICHTEDNQSEGDAEDDLEEEENESVDQNKEVNTELVAKPAGELCVRIPKDKVRCRNKAIVIVGKDRIAVGDAENHAVKIIDTELQMAISETELSSRPNGIAFLPDDLLAVALPEESMILFLSISNRLSEAYHLKVDGRCTDLAYCPGKLVVAYQNPGKVEIMDEKGHINRTIQQNIHGASLYDDSRVSIGTDNKSFYISDRFFKNITCFSWNGTIICEYNSQSLIRPCGIAALGDGSLLVCNSSNHSIHLISPKLTQDRVILEKKDGLKHPWSVAVDNEKNKLFVGSVDTSDYVNVYEMKHINAKCVNNST